MKAFKAIYQHGHFIDVETNRRLVPIQGENYIISASDKAFIIEDENSGKENLLDSTKKAEWALGKFGIDKHFKIMNSGEQLFFRIGNSSSIKGDESSQYIFVCTLLEDLYIYLMNGKKGDDLEDWRLAKCKCILSECILGGLTLSKNITAESFNQLFSNTVQFYFSQQRSGSANAFDTFFFYKKGMDITFERAIYGKYDGLAKARKEFVFARKKVKDTGKKKIPKSNERKRIKNNKSEFSLTMQ